MKKREIIVSGFLSIALLLGSCNKEEVVVTPQHDNNNVRTVKTINQLSTEFINSQVRLDKDMDRKLNWWKIVGKDLMGAAAGAIAGSVPGAILGGVGASLYEAGSQMAAAPAGGTGTGAGNPANIYDFVGKEHVQILNTGLTSDRDLLLDADGTLKRDVYLPYAKDYLVAMGYFTMADLDRYSTDQFNRDLDWTIGMGDASTTESIADLAASGALTTFEADVLRSYFDAFEASTSFEAFYGYSLRAERAIIDDRDISSTSKIIILSTMATTRYDYNYWEE